MTIDTIMTCDVAQIPPDLPLAAAAEMMEQKRISSLLVVENGQYVGILTERDMVRGIANEVMISSPVSVLMSVPLVSVPLDSSKADAYYALIKNGIRHLLVLDKDGRAAGIVSETDFRKNGNIEHFIQLRDVRGSMSSNITILSESACVADAANLMTQSNIDYVLVGSNQHTSGILTERDIVRLFRQNDHARQLNQVMTKQVCTISLDAKLHEAAQRMNEEHIRHLIVKDTSGLTVGVLSEHDIVKHIEDGYIKMLQDIIQTQAKKLEKIQTELIQNQLHEAVAAGNRPFLEVLDSLPVKIFVKDIHSVFIFCNKALAEDLGIDPAMIQQKTDFDFFPPELAQHYRDDDAKVISENKSIDLIEPFQSENRELWVHTSKAPWRDTKGNIGGVIGIFRDVTQEYMLKLALQRKTKLYAVVSQCNSAIVHIQDEQLLLEKICEIVLDFGDFPLAWIGRENTDHQVMPIVTKGKAIEYVLNLGLTTKADLASGQGPTETAIRENRAIVINDFVQYSASFPWYESAKRNKLFGVIALPIIAKDFRGALMIYADTINYFDAEVVDLFKELVSEICFALNQIYAHKMVAQQKTQLDLSDQMFAQSVEAMVITDTQNNIIRVNKAFSDMTGYSSEEVLGKNPRILKSNKHDRDFYVAMWRSLEVQGSWQGELWNRRKNGEICLEWSSINLVRDVSGKIVNYFAIFSDLLQKRAVQELEHLKHFDPLTDLPNRALLEDRISGAISHANLYHRFLGVAFLNLSHFHTVNDMFGLLVGDQMLVTTAQRLVDAVPRQATVTRLSADTFVILLPDLNTSEEINLITGVIVQKVYQPFTVEEQQIQLSAEMGIAVYPLDGQDAKTLMMNADAALSDAKRSGIKHSVRFFSSAMNEHANKLVTMGAELRSAIAENRLVLYYQPQVDIVSGQIIGAEALIRINHPERGIISPAEFISVAEETGLIVQIGEWVIREACRQMKQWQVETQSELIIAVNLSPLQLRHPDLYELIKSILNESGLEPRFLELEFTESAIMQNVHELIVIMQRFKTMGVQLSIDDFGTGYSSLSYLKQFPVNKLKIDQSFVSNITQDPNDAAIVQAIIALSRTLGLVSIAEGVETEAQLGYLRSLHCQEMQGYLYSRPLPASEFAALLNRGKTLELSSSEKTLLLVDDEENVLISLKRILRREGYKILTASSGEEGLEILAKNTVNVLLSDQRMPGISGVEFLHRVKIMYPDVVRMILSGYTEVGTLTEAINKGEIYQFITKPWENESIIALIREAFVRYDMMKRSTN